MELVTTVSDDLDSIFESVRQRAILCNAVCKIKLEK